jgi:hypothetical protein
LPGEPTYCFKRCTASTNCRLGYFCEFLIGVDGGSTADGLCSPIDCASPNRVCPSGTGCRITGGHGTCVTGYDAGM